MWKDREHQFDIILQWANSQRAVNCCVCVCVCVCVLAVYLDAEDEQLLEDEAAVPTDSKRSVSSLQLASKYLISWSLIGIVDCIRLQVT